MAKTSMLTTNALTMQWWAKKGFIDIYKKAQFGRMFDRGSIFRAEELDRAKKGDEVTFSFNGILTGIGIGEGGTLTGNEEKLDLQSHTMKWNVFRHAVCSPNEDTIEQVRTNVDFDKNARELLPEFHRSRLDASAFNQLAGVDSTTIEVDTAIYSGDDRTFVQGLNTVNAPTANRILRAGGTATTDELLTTADTMNLDIIDAAIETLQRTYPYAGPLEGEEFDLYVSHEQETDLKRDSTGKIQWYGNYLATIQGGDTMDNMIMNGSKYGTQRIGKYANVNIIPTTRVATGVDSVTNAAIPTVRRAVLVGKNALSFGSAFSGALSGDKERGGQVPFKFTTQLKDYDYDSGVEARMIYGLKKVQFSNEDFGSLVISTYAAPHAA